MTINDRLTNCAVIGAAGKMGRGIALVLLKEMISTDLKLKRPLSTLICIDRSIDDLITLRDYLDVQMLKFAERNISTLRNWYREETSLIDNSEIIDHFLRQCRSVVTTDSSYLFINNTQMIFEAVFENLEIKNSVYSQIKEICPKSCLFFSNTSSIPITELNYRNDLFGRLIGFHFYNPPAVQKLVEVISSSQNKKEDIKLSHELISRLGKLAVPSNDIAGFIGNGHFIREGLYYLSQIDTLPFSNTASLLFINNVIQNLMFRPMGIFQLIDYVGIDVFEMICTTMDSYIKEDFKNQIIKSLQTSEVKGGQFGNGSQRDGFFKYDNGKISAVYDWEKKNYISIEHLNKELSEVEFPPLKENWKSLSRSKDLNYISNTFIKYSKSDHLPQNHAVKFLIHSRKIARNLVNDKVADKIDYVNDVMINGFYHLYGPASEILDCFSEVANE